MYPSFSLQQSPSFSVMNFFELLNGEICIELKFGKYIELVWYITKLITVSITLNISTHVENSIV